MRIWGKICKDSRILEDRVIEDQSDETRTHKVFRAMDEFCDIFDLAKPLWLNASVREFQEHAKVRFYQDHFMEPIEFDYFEIQVLEEDV